MENFKNCIDYLKDPELVARFQKCFGVVRLVMPENGIMLSPVETNDRRTNSSAVRRTNGVDHHITNKFWYYLFFCGTYLGDEIGYSIVIPFLIWNVDSAVSRKMVIVWAVVMYIGNPFLIIYK